MSFVYQLPTTGSISYADFLLDENKQYLNDISEATALRGRVRTILKETARTEGPKDYTNIMKTVEDYLPYLFGIVDCLEGGQLKLKKEFETSWRCTLSDAMLKKKKPRVVCHDIYYELIFTLLTYGYSYSNRASSMIQQHLEKDEIDRKLNKAADLLCKAAGIFAYIAEEVCPKWTDPPATRPPDVFMEMSTSLSTIALADASSIAIRKALMSRTSSSLLAKLAIGVAEQYEKANGLIKSLKDSGKVCPDFRKYVSYGPSFNQSVGYKFLSKDAFEREELGKAIGYLTHAKDTFHQLSKSKSTTIATHASQEYNDTVSLYSTYVKLNDTTYYQTIPSKEDLQSLIPNGRIALNIIQYKPPAPAFGPGTEKSGSQKLSYDLEGRYY